MVKEIKKGETPPTMPREVEIVSFIASKLRDMLGSQKNKANSESDPKGKQEDAQTTKD